MYDENHDIPKHRRKKLKRKLCRFAVEYHRMPMGERGRRYKISPNSKGWRIWGRYMTARDRDNALRQLKHNHAYLGYQFRSKDL